MPWGSRPAQSAGHVYVHRVMLNAVNLSFMAFAHFLNSVDGWMFVFFVLSVAAAEVVVGLAIIVAIFRSRQNIDVDELSSLKG